MMPDQDATIDAVRLMREIRNRLSNQFAGKSYDGIKRIIAEKCPVDLGRGSGEEPTQRTA
jgi:hypothetical protein